ncbi:O-antigen ligase family protein [Leptospira sp. 96542]|nr:O-antigen ligase family protein [Leptospira sp. 96542]
MIRKERFETLGVVFLGLFFVFAPVSVSFSQISIGVSFFLLFPLRYQKCQWKDPLLLFALLLYISITIPNLWLERSLPWKRIFTYSETSDVWMVLVLLLGSILTTDEKEKLKTYIYLGAVVLVLTGLISLFFPYRLSNFVMDGLKYVDGKRLPHKLMDLRPNIALYLPIGFQNTHLSLGGLLALYLPWLFIGIDSKKKTKWVFSFLFLILGFIVLFFNQSRSVLFGIIIAPFLMQNFQWDFVQRQKKKFIFFILIILLFVALLFQYNWLFKKAITDIFAKRSLENQRVLIHKANYSMLSEYWKTGIGSGNYPEQFKKSMENFVLENPEMYYEVSITPKKHAHFDLLHFWILGGIPGLLCFVGFVFIVTTRMKLEKNNAKYLIGIITIFLASVFQCYLLDDEVILPLFCFLIFLPTENKQTTNKRLFLFLILYWASALVFLYFYAKKDARDIFFHRARTENNFPSKVAERTIGGKYPVFFPNDTSQFYFKLEGCLDHKLSFYEKPIPRKSDFVFTFLKIEPNEGESDNNYEYPNKVTIEIRKRESFDQDERYAVQKEVVLETKSFTLNKARTEVRIPPPPVTSGAIHFIDFGIGYEFNSVTVAKTKVLPNIDIRPLCD